MDVTVRGRKDGNTQIGENHVDSLPGADEDDRKPAVRRSRQISNATFVEIEE
jgi:hypothetical protein